MAERVSLRGTTATKLGIAVTIGMAILYLAKPIAETNIFGVSLMAAGTGLLLLGAYSGQGAPIRRLGGRMGVVPWFGRLSYELYLFHLVVLGGMRIVWPARAVAGDGKLLLLVGYLSALAVLAVIVARFYPAPLNLGLRRLLAIRSSPAPVTKVAQ